MAPLPTLHNSQRYRRPGPRVSAGHTASMSTALRFLPVVAVTGVIFALSAQRQLPEPLGPDLTNVAGHFLVYASLAVLLWWALAQWEPTAGWSLALAFVGAMAFALGDEWHQAFVPGRSPSLSDLGVDALGAFCALAAVRLWVWSRRKRDPGASDRDTASHHP
jgi:VanZ family protein